MEEAEHYSAYPPVCGQGRAGEKKRTSIGEEGRGGEQVMVVVAVAVVAVTVTVAVAVVVVEVLVVRLRPSPFFFLSLSPPPFFIVMAAITFCPCPRECVRHEYYASVLRREEGREERRERWIQPMEDGYN
jgi:hypothetical protein